jgi:glycosyltransferase involved in cell wall biosynthesis
LPDGRHTPDITVIVPVYNGGGLLDEAIHSVLRQSGVAFELIVVDDGSTDDTAARVTAVRDRRVRLVRLPRNQGTAAARNAGIAEARSALLAFLDADDMCTPGRLEAQWRHLEAQPRVDVLGGALEIVDEGGRRIGYRAYPLTHERIVSRLPCVCSLAVSAVAARKAAVLAVGGFTPDCRYVEDYDLWSRMALNGARFAALPEVVTRYRIHRGSIKCTQVKGQLRGTIAVKQRYWLKRMKTAARLRLAAEHALLLLPGRVVLRLFLLTAFRRRPPGPSA